MNNENKETITNDNSYSLDRNRDLVAEKLIMNELLNAEDFNILLQTIQEEFKRTFTYKQKNNFER